MLRVRGVTKGSDVTLPLNHHHHNLGNNPAEPQSAHPRTGWHGPRLPAMRGQAPAASLVVSPVPSRRMPAGRNPSRMALGDRSEGMKSARLFRFLLMMSMRH